jgi:two-component system response regulator
MMSNSEPRQILLAEDIGQDIEVFLHAFRSRKAEERWELQVVTDGLAALEFLYRQGVFAEAKRPDLVVLNINMPRVNGWEVLRKMKADPQLRRIPTVIWTVADMEKYNARAYDMGACGIFSKPVGAKEAERQIDAILTYFTWANPSPPYVAVG